MITHRSKLSHPPGRQPYRHHVSVPARSKNADEVFKLYRTLGDPFVVVSMHGQITGFNNAFRRMLVYSAAELRSLRYQDLTPSKWHAFERDIIRRQVLPRGHSDVYEKEYRRKDGVVFPVELRTFLIRDAKGRPSEMWAIVRDITARKRAEERLGMAQFALEQLSLAAFWVAEDARILYVNKAACRSLGYSREELQSMKIMDIDPAMTRRRWTRHWNAGTSKRTRVIETVHRARNGREFPVEIAINSFTVDGRQYHCDFVRDITERKEFEAEQDRIRRVLDETVRERTAELRATIQALRKEAANRRRIESALRLRQNQLRALVSELAVAEGRERERIATGIHDDISQMLAAAKLKTGQLGQNVTSNLSSRLVSELDEILSRVLNTSRSLTFDLASPVLHKIGLNAALDDLCDRMSENAAVRFSFWTDGNGMQMDRAVQEFVYQSARQLMHNVVNHARAHQARVSLAHSNRVLRLTVSDDGIGFGRSALKGFRPTGGFGLHAIRERIRYLGGQLVIRTVSPHGSAVTLTVPLSHAQPDPA